MKIKGKKGFVYLLSDDSDEKVYKIGATRKPIQERINELQTGNHNGIYICDYYETKNPFIMETMLHNKHKFEKKRGEWYCLTEETVKNFKNECDLCEKNIDALKDNVFFTKNRKIY